MTSDSILIDMF